MYIYINEIKQARKFYLHFDHFFLSSLFRGATSDLSDMI